MDILNDLICSGCVVILVEPCVYSVFGNGACGTLLFLASGKWAYCDDYCDTCFVANSPYEAVHGFLSTTY